MPSGALLCTLRRTLVFDRAGGVLALEQGAFGMIHRATVPLFHLRAVVIVAGAGSSLLGLLTPRARYLAYLDRRVGDAIHLDESARCADLLPMAEAIAEVAELRLEYDATSQVERLRRCAPACRRRALARHGCEGRPRRRRAPGRPASRARAARLTRSRAAAGSRAARRGVRPGCRRGHCDRAACGGDVGDPAPRAPAPKATTASKKMSPVPRAAAAGRRCRACAAAGHINESFDGAWVDPAAVGTNKGLLVDYIPSANTFFFAFFTYDATGKQLWTTGSFQPQNGVFEYGDVPVSIVTGGQFAAQGAPTYTQIGTVDIALSCDAIQMAFSPSQASGLSAAAFDLKPSLGLDSLTSGQCNLPIQACPEGTTAEGDDCLLPNSITGDLILPAGKKYIPYCDTGRRSSAGAFLLSECGHQVLCLKGGLNGAG